MRYVLLILLLLAACSAAPSVERSLYDDLVDSLTAASVPPDYDLDTEPLETLTPSDTLVRFSFDDVTCYARQPRDTSSWYWNRVCFQGPELVSVTFFQPGPYGNTETWLREGYAPSYKLGPAEGRAWHLHKVAQELAECDCRDSAYGQVLELLRKEADDCYVGSFTIRNDSTQGELNESWEYCNGYVWAETSQRLRDQYHSLVLNETNRHRFIEDSEYHQRFRFFAPLECKDGFAEHELSDGRTCYTFRKMGGCPHYMYWEVACFDGERLTTLYTDDWNEGNYTRAWEKEGYPVTEELRALVT